MTIDKIELFNQLPSPIPTPNVEVYNGNRDKILINSAETRENYHKFEVHKRQIDIDYLPVKIDIENVSRCNFHCTMCQVSGWPRGKRAEDMNLDLYKQFIDSQYGLVEIKLQGMGEPTLGGADYLSMIAYARNRGIWVRTITNASLLHKNDTYKKLIDTDPSEIQISVDGATKESFEKIRKGGNFEQVCNNCRLINAYCDKVDKIRTKMWVVLQRDNIQEILNLVELAVELGFKHLVLSPDLNDWGQDKWLKQNTKNTIKHIIDPDVMFKALARSKELGITLGFWMTTSKYNAESPETLCSWPFERAYISSDFRVVPCCMLGNPEVADMGDAREFTNVWLGKKYRQFRKDHLSGNIPRICQGCYE